MILYVVDGQPLEHPLERCVFCGRDTGENVVSLVFNDAELVVEGTDVEVHLVGRGRPCSGCWPLLRAENWAGLAKRCGRSGNEVQPAAVRTVEVIRWVGEQIERIET